VGAAVLLIGLVVPFVDNMIGMPYNGGSEHSLRK